MINVKYNYVSYPIIIESCIKSSYIIVTKEGIVLTRWIIISYLTLIDFIDIKSLFSSISGYRFHKIDVKIMDQSNKYNMSSNYPHAKPI